MLNTAAPVLLFNMKNWPENCRCCEITRNLVHFCFVVLDTVCVLAHMFDHNLLTRSLKWKGDSRDWRKIAYSGMFYGLSV